jgi:hypothetical protein
MIRVYFVASERTIPKRLDRSITGTIRPRRLMTPSTNGGDAGTAVHSWKRMIS